MPLLPTWRRANRIYTQQGDPYFASVSLLLHMDGSNGSTTFTDSSPNQLAITTFGDTRISTAQSRFGGESALFDGDEDYLRAADPGLAFGTGDFTVEGWMYVVDGTSYRAIASFVSGSDNDALYILDNTLIWYNLGNQARSSSFTSNAWHHFAVTRSSGTLRVFLNGVESSSNYASISNITSGSVRIGTRGGTNGEWFSGYIDEFRVTKGVARYTANFTPSINPFPDRPKVGPTAFLLPPWRRSERSFKALPFDLYFNNVSLLLHMDGSDNSINFIDSSNGENVISVFGNARLVTSGKKYGTASLALDGTGDYLATPANSSFQFGPNDFTIEFWCKPTLIDRNDAVFSFGELGNTLFLILSNNVWYLGTNPSATQIMGSALPDLNKWRHIAVTRSGSSLRLFVDGIQLGSTLENSADLMADRLNIGYSGFTGTFSGYIDEFRVTKGVARYTANFTPPTEPFPDRGGSVIVDAPVAGTTMIGITPDLVGP